MSEFSLQIFHFAINPVNNFYGKIVSGVVNTMLKVFK